MQKAGHEVVTARDGEEALAAAKARRPDLMLLDLMMPRGDGYDVCRTLRALPGYEAMRIVMLTARGRESEQLHGLSLGADAYVTKPFAIGDVVGCVSALLARPRLKTG